MEALPLLELFTQLREAGLPLGIGEYQLVLKAWQSGYGRRDRAALARLCRTVWVKSPEDDRIFQVQFDRLIKHQPAHASGTSATSSTARRLWTPQNIVLGVFAVSSLIFLGGYWLMLPKAKPTKSNSISALPSLINDSSITLYEASLPVVERVPSDVMPTNSSRAADSDSPDQIADEVEERLEEQDNVVKAIPAEVLLTQKTFLKQYGLALWVSLWLASGAAWGVLQWRKLRQQQSSDNRPSMSLALTQQMRDEVQVARLSQAMTTGDYLPVTRRQMKQSWRHLRRMVREGPPTELDLDATVQDIGRHGLLLSPVFRARRVNRAEVLLLIDQEGSMV